MIVLPSTVYKNCHTRGLSNTSVDQFQHIDGLGKEVLQSRTRGTRPNAATLGDS
jgi:hypothetical protein